MAKTKNSAPKGAKKSSTKKVVSIPVVETPDVETPVVDTPVVDSPVVDAPVVEGYDAEFSAISEQLKVALTLVKDLTVKFNALEKRVSRDRKVMDKKMKGRVKRVKDPNAPPSGFAKPGPVSDEMRKFLSLGKDDLIARTQGTKRITTYCIENNLQNQSDKRIILPDKALTKLLNIPKGEELTYFNLQKYMKVHFANKEGVYPTL